VAAGAPQAEVTIDVEQSTLSLPDGTTVKFPLEDSPVIAAQWRRRARVLAVEGRGHFFIRRKGGVPATHR
jgi:hypothetical protein